MMKLQILQSESNSKRIIRKHRHRTMPGSACKYHRHKFEEENVLFRLFVWNARCRYNCGLSLTQMQKILSVPRMKCLCYSKYAKKCKFLSENLWNVPLYPLAWEFSPLTKFIVFYVKECWKKGLVLCSLSRRPNAVIFFVESRLLNVFIL